MSKKKKTKVTHTLKRQNYFKNFNHYKTILTTLFLCILMFLLPKSILNDYAKTLDYKTLEVQEKQELEELVIPKHVTFSVTDDGYNLFVPSSSKKGYRYGPSIIYYDDGTMDAWFASNANNKEWDWITYRHFDGEEWLKEKIVLQPTGNSYDYNSCCDPGVIYFNGYYYLGYTSTIVETEGGINNNVFVARSLNPDGPYEKWNGNGWGGDPYPIIYYDESDAFWGAGEVSFCIKDNILYIYYSWLCADGDYTKVATADLSENWPLSIEEKGFALTRIGGQDSIDVVYLEDIDKFLAFSNYSRFTNRSGILIMSSDDGIEFHKEDFISTGTTQYVHNLGISKRPNGHITLDDDLLVGYAYGTSSTTWGNWACRFQSIKLHVYEGQEKRFDKDGEPTFRNLYDNLIDNGIYTIGINVDNRTIKLNEGQSSTINLYTYNSILNKALLTSGFTVEYDEEMVSVNGLTVKALKQGESEIKIYYNDFYTTCKVVCYESGFNRNIANPKIVKFEPVYSNITAKLSDGDYFVKQIRAYVEYENGKWGEAYNDYTSNHWEYPAMVDAGTYHMEFYYDEDIIEVSDEGLIYPKKLGETDVKVTLDDLEFTVHVSVK